MRLSKAMYNVQKVQHKIQDQKYKVDVVIVLFIGELQEFEFVSQTVFDIWTKHDQVNFFSDIITPSR